MCVWVGVQGTHDCGPCYVYGVSPLMSIVSKGRHFNFCAFLSYLTSSMLTFVYFIEVLVYSCHDNSGQYWFGWQVYNYRAGGKSVCSYFKVNLEMSPLI